MWRLAEEATSGADLTTLTQYGVLGVFAVLLTAFARVAYKRETDRSDVAYRRETERSDRLEQEVLRLNTIIQDKVIPALQSSARAVEESQALLASMQREREYALQRRARRDEESSP